MTAPQVEVHLRILLPQVHNAVKRHIQMRVRYRELAFIPPRLQFAVYMQVGVGVVLISEFPHVRFHVPGERTVIDLALGRQVQRYGLQLGKIEHASQAEVLSYHPCVIGHMRESRIRVESTVRRDCS